ncbi:hypothetical protein VAEKB19_6810004 [Vibrio aestuarianus]|nr:hypothetical protein VAEKB19_6810004 [Vibrio aestuarianus]
MLASEGWSQVMISQALRIHESTVARHLSEGGGRLGRSR